MTNEELLAWEISKGATVKEPDSISENAVERSGLEVFLDRYAHTEFKWGWNDCNTFIVEYVDYLKDTTIINEVKGKYYDARSAFRFTRDYKKLDAGLEEQGFVQADELQDGDIISYVKNGFVCGHIYAYNRAHSMDTDYGYICVPVDNINLNDPYLKIWRYNG